MFVEDIHQEKGACGRYKNKEKRKSIFIIFDNIDMEKGACGRYNNKHKSMNELMNGLMNSLNS